MFVVTDYKSALSCIRTKKVFLNMKKAILILILFFTTIVVFVYINVFINSRQEYLKKYNFIIAKIETDTKGNLIFYDSLYNKYSFANYRFKEWDKLGISVGDKVLKDSLSKNMNICRKIKNEYKIYYIQKPNGTISFSFYGY